MSDITEQGYQYCKECKKSTWHTPKLGLVMLGKRLCTVCRTSNEYEKMLGSDHIVIKLSDVLENVEYLSTTEGDEYECITIENLRGLALDNIKEVYEEKGYFGSHWHIDDIIDKAEEMGYECSIEEAMDIASTIMKHDDCNHGITWDTLEYGIEEKFKVKEDGK